MAGSYLPPQGFGLPSLQTASKASSKSPDPAASVGSYVNQQLAGLVSGTSPVVGSSDRMSPSLPGAQSADVELNPVQKSVANVSTSIKQSNDRIKLYAEAAQRKRTLKQTGGVQYGDMGNIGQAYTPDGNLSASRNRALQLAASYVGTPYVLGGTGYKGIDCSGLVMMVYRQLGFNLPHDSGVQGRTAGTRTALQNLRPGDLVAWKDGHHIAIYAGNGMIYEAPAPGLRVRLRRITNPGGVYGVALRLPGE